VANRGDKKRGVTAPRHTIRLSNLSPQIIVVNFAFRRLLRTVFFVHALEDGRIRGGHVDDFKTDIICVGVSTIATAPFAAGNEHHESLMSNVGRELDLQPQDLSGRDLFMAVQPEPTGTDVCEVPDPPFGQRVGDLHVIDKVTAGSFSLLGHDVRSFLH
jgi:hypothetical protein